MEPAGNADELTENKRRRLIFRSDHRGTKEMDLIMGQFAKAHVPTFSEEELVQYDTLLCNNDPDLYNWISGIEDAPAEVAAMGVFQQLMKSRV